MRNSPQQPPQRRARGGDPQLESVMIAMKVGAGVTVVFLACFFATLVFAARNLFGGPGSWLDDNLGPPSLGPAGVALLAMATVVLFVAMRRIDDRLRHDPVYGKEPRPR